MVCRWGLLLLYGCDPIPHVFYNGLWALATQKKTPIEMGEKHRGKCFIVSNNNVYRDTTISRPVTALIDLTLQLFASVNCTSNWIKFPLESYALTCTIFSPNPWLSVVNVFAAKFCGANVLRNDVLLTRIAPVDEL